MTITVFNNITVEIPDEQANYLIEYGNGAVIPSVYETLLINSNITPQNYSKDYIVKEVQKMISEEVEAAKIINDMWDKGEL